MKYYTITLLALFLAVTSYAQEPTKRNFIYLEAGGNGLLASVNYERQLTKEPGIGFRIGTGFYSEEAFYLTIPVGINYLFQLKDKNSFIEAGLGLTLARVDANLFTKSKNSNADHLTNFIPSFGYRKHINERTFWRISATPIINKFGIVPWIGLAIGKAF
jgi:hypothetical protein